MKIYEFRSDISVYEDVSEPIITVETELFLTKQKAIEYMRNKALEFENANSSEEFFWAIDSDPEGAEVIELDSSCNSDVFGIFSIVEREVNECILKATI